MEEARTVTTLRRPRLTQQQHGQLSHLQVLADLPGEIKWSSSQEAPKTTQEEDEEVEVAATNSHASDACQRRQGLLQQIQLVTQIRKGLQAKLRQTLDSERSQHTARQALYDSRSDVLRLCAITEALQGNYQLPTYDHYIHHFDVPLQANAQQPPPGQNPPAASITATEQARIDRQKELASIVLGRKPAEAGSRRLSKEDTSKGGSTGRPNTNTQENRNRAPSTNTTNKNTPQNNQQISNETTEAMEIDEYPVQTRENSEEIFKPPRLVPPKGKKSTLPGKSSKKTEVKINKTTSSKVATREVTHYERQSKRQGKVDPPPTVPPPSTENSTKEGTPKDSPQNTDDMQGMGAPKSKKDEEEEANTESKSLTSEQPSQSFGDFAPRTETASSESQQERITADTDKQDEEANKETDSQTPTADNIAENGHSSALAGSSIVQPPGAGLDKFVENEVPVKPAASKGASVNKDASMATARAFTASTEGTQDAPQLGKGDSSVDASSVPVDSNNLNTTVPPVTKEKANSAIKRGQTSNEVKAQGLREENSKLLTDLTSQTLQDEKLPSKAQAADRHRDDTSIVLSDNSSRKDGMTNEGDTAIASKDVSASAVLHEKAEEQASGPALQMESNIPKLKVTTPEHIAIDAIEAPDGVAEAPNLIAQAHDNLNGNKGNIDSSETARETKDGTTAARKRRREPDDSADGKPKESNSKRKKGSGKRGAAPSAQRKRGNERPLSALTGLWIKEPLPARTKTEES